MRNKFKEYLKSVRFFLPSEEVIARLYEAFDTARREAAEQIREDETNGEADRFLSAIERPEVEFSAEREIDQFRRFIPEQLYFHLGFLSSGQPALRGNSFDIRETVALESSCLFGLPAGTESLYELADEFTEWLRETGEFGAGWGRIIYAGEDRMYLVENPRKPADHDIAPKLEIRENPLNSRRKEKVRVVGGD